MPPPRLPDATRRQLLELARRAARRAYCPYSGFHVGAAVMASDGRIFSGANVENASYGLTICAERSAIFTAASSGAHRLRAVAVTCPDADQGAPPAYRMPCGACRQVIAEFAAPGLVVVVGGVKEFRLEELLPEAFVLPARPGRETPPGEKPVVCVDLDSDPPAEAGGVLGELAADFRLVYVVGEQGLLPEAARDWPSGPIVFAEPGKKHLAAQGAFGWVGAAREVGEAAAREGAHALLIGANWDETHPDGLVHTCEDWAGARAALLELVGKA